MQLLKNRPSTFAWALMAVFLVSRGLILFGYSTYMPDSPFFWYDAHQAVFNGHRAYRDFSFTYLPLTLPFVYLPYLCGKFLHHYAPWMKLEMFLVDIACFRLLILICRRRLGFDERRTFAVAAISSLFALGVGHSLYDRIDLFVALSLLGSVYLFGHVRTRLALYLPSLLVTLMKIVPVFWLPVLIVLDNARRCSGTREWVRKTVRDLIVCLGGATLFCVAYDRLWSAGGLWATLKSHGWRGIQVESVWATPFMFFRKLAPNKVFFIKSFGSMHLGGPGVPEAYIALSKVAGFALLVVALFAWARWLVRARAGLKKSNAWPLATGRGATEYVASALLLVVLLLLVSQRVLSPQFFIWAIYPLALHIVLWQAAYEGAISVLLYALCFVNFRHDYVRLLDGGPGNIFLIVLALRNATLVWLFVLVASDFITRYHLTKPLPEEA